MAAGGRTAHGRPTRRDFDHPEQCTKASYDYFAAVPEKASHSLTVKVYDFDTDAELTTFTVELP